MPELEMEALLNKINTDKGLAGIFQHVQALGIEDAAHDSAHLLRVALWTCRLMENKAPVRISVAAALLHDLVNLPKNSPDRERASEYSAKAAAPLLGAANFGPEEILEIQAAIHDHSYSRGVKPSSFLGQCLQDADRLEALGAIGIMRVFSTGVKLNAQYFHAEDPWATNRDLDDKKYSVDHFFTKLLKLPESMNTAAGRGEAKRRADVLKNFLETLGSEIGIPCVF